MITFLFNNFNFDEQWAADSLADLFDETKSVCILPVLLDEGWAMDDRTWKREYIEDEEAVYSYTRPFRSYRIPETKIRILNYHEESSESIASKIRTADILVLACNDAVSAMNVLEDYELCSLITEFEGILIGVGDGAKLLMDQYYDYKRVERFQGLGVVEGFGLCLHYQEHIIQLRQIIEDLEINGDAVVVCPEKGGVMIDGGNVEMIGNAFIADERDLDELYQLVEEEEEKQ